MDMIKIEHNGRIFYFEEEVEGNVLRTLKKGRFYEQTMLKFIVKNATQGVIIDVGANLGNHSVFLAGNIKNTKVIALEPNPEIFKTLKSNIWKNKLLSKTELYNIAAGNKNRTCDIELGPNKDMGRGRIVEGESIAMKTLDELVGNEKISIIKIDVEGFEPQVLRGATNILKNSSPKLFIEAHNNKAKRELDTVLEPWGYKAVKVFNRTATYYYVKNPSYNSKIHEMLQNVIIKLKRFRIFRPLW